MTGLVLAPPSLFWDHTRDLSLPQHQRKVDALKSSIRSQGYRQDWTDLPIRAGTHDGQPWISEGHHRLQALKELGDDSPIPMSISHTRTAVQQPPEGLSFTHSEQQSGGSKWPTQHQIGAVLPGEDQHAGVLKYLTSPSRRKILIDNLSVPQHQRQGIGSALMDELQRRHPGASINHGDRTDDGKAWWSGYSQGKPVSRGRTAVLSDEDHVSVAEHAMEQSGHAGREFYIPKARRHDVPEGEDEWYGMRKLQRHHSREAEDCVHHALTSHGWDQGDGERIRVMPEHYDLQQPRAGQAITDGMNYIGLKGKTTNKMTLLHECAHILTRTHEGPGGHGPEFQQAAHQLYHDHISPEAADTFAGIMHMRPKQASTYTVRLEHGRRRQPGSYTVPEDGPVTPAYLEHPVGVSHVRVEVPHQDEHGRDRDMDSMDAEAHQTAAQMSSYPGADMVTRSDIISLEARRTPHQRVFGPTYGLDRRLWEPSGQLKPAVRAFVLRKVGSFFLRHYGPSWDAWARIYFAGSEASLWTGPELIGNSDFDTLIGINYKAMRKAVTSVRHMNNQAITTQLNGQYRAELNDKDEYIPTPEGEIGPFDATFYTNADSYDIRRIRPYAAYDVGADSWVVRPADLPAWGTASLPKTVLKALRAAESYARDILRLPEPHKTQQGASLFDAWHSDRSRAFSERGEGWWDFGNLREKWLDQQDVWAQLVQCKHDADAGLDLGPADWSNIPIWETMASARQGVSSLGVSGPGNAWHGRQDRTAATDKWPPGLTEKPDRKARLGATPSRLERSWGGQDLHRLFPVDEDGPAPRAPAPWPQAGRRKDRQDYDPETVRHALSNPHEHPLEEVDPRILHATQPSLTRTGVKHYLGDEYHQTGRTYADQHNPGNRHPVIYHRTDDDQHIILSGHHRAAAALLRGEPLQAMVLHGSYGASRHTALLDPHAVTHAEPEQFAQRFHDTVGGTEHQHHVSFHSPEEIREHGMTPLSANHGQTGALVHDHGDGRIEATGLYNRSQTKGAGIDMLRHTMDHHGVNYVECYGPRLPKLYEGLGFKTTEKYPFDKDLAHPNWDYDKFDHPDYHVMHREGHKMAALDAEQHWDDPQWLAAQRERIEAELVAEHGQQWVDEHREFADADWQAALAQLGLS